MWQLMVLGSLYLIVWKWLEQLILRMDWGGVKRNRAWLCQFNYSFNSDPFRRILNRKNRGNVSQFF